MHPPKAIADILQWPADMSQSSLILKKPAWHEAIVTRSDSWQDCTFISDQQDVVLHVLHDHVPIKELNHIAPTSPTLQRKSQPQDFDVTLHHIPLRFVRCQIL